GPVDGEFPLVEPWVNGECTYWWATMAQFAEKIHVGVGFETTFGCGIGRGGAGRTSPTMAFEGLTPREVLDRLMEKQPEFAWQEVDGAVVIRPVASWKAPAPALHKRVRPFAIEGVHPPHALHTLLQSAEPSL